jgi:hypothetical protein
MSPQTSQEPQMMTPTAASPAPAPPLDLAPPEFRPEAGEMAQTADSRQGSARRDLEENIRNLRLARAI